MSSIQFNMTESVQRSVECGMQKGVEKAATSLVNDVVQQLAEKYDQINIEEAMEMLGVMTLSKKPKKTKKLKLKTKSDEEPKERVLKLPWCGQVLPNCCQAIQSCGKLYVQCRHDKLEDGDYCKRCQTATNKNGGTPPYGVIQDRFDADYKDKKGEKPIKYGNYMKTNEITREDAEAEAAKLGWTIPPEQFEVVVKPKGRKKKDKTANVEASDTDGEDIITKLANEKGAAADDSTDDDSSDDDEPLGAQVNKRISKKRESVPSNEEKDAKRACVQEEEHSELDAESMNESEEESGGEEFD